MHKNIGGFKFGDLAVHRQTAKLNVSPIFLRLRYIDLIHLDYIIHCEWSRPKTAMESGRCPFYVNLIQRRLDIFSMCDYALNTTAFLPQQFHTISLRGAVFLGQ